MRCYLKHWGHIAGVRMLSAGASDEVLMEEARRAFAEARSEQHDGFEVWDQRRFICRFPPDDEPTPTSDSSRRQDAE